MMISNAPVNVCPVLTRRRGRRMFPVRTSAVLAALTVAMSGCSAGVTTDQPSTSASTLTIGLPAAPASLDPAKTTGNGQSYLNLAYDPLIYRAPDGKLTPRLATSWNYVGTTNTIFEMHLRPNVKFSDGSALSADVVKANFAYLREVGAGTAVTAVAKDAAVDVIDPLTVRLTLSKPNPILPTLFTQDYLIGVISGQALQHPQTLATETDGAGPYSLNAALTVAGDHYTYRTNSHYWNPKSVHFHSVVIKVLPNANTRLAAIKTGQVDTIAADYTIVKAAKSAGLTIAYTPQSFVGLVLADRAGTVTPALRDVRVRQALNYAVDRQAIAQALFGQYGLPTDQIQLPGGDGRNAHAHYSYDPAKAKQLLAAAGYARGFALPVLTSTQLSSNVLVQAVADQLKQVGIRLELTNDAQAPKFLQDVASRKWPAYAIAFGSISVYQMGKVLFLPGGLYNPFNSADPQLTAWYNEAAASSAAQRAALDQQIIGRLVQQGWFVPIVFSPLVYVTRSTVQNVRVSPGEPLADPVGWQPAP